MNHCMRHYEEPLMAYCRTCRNPFCSRCLVFSHGPNKPPYCVGCALFASGIRNGSNRAAAPGPMPEVGAPATPGTPAPAMAMEASPTQDRRAERAYKRAERAAQRQQAKLMRKQARKTSEVPMEGEEEEVAPPQARIPAPSSVVPAPSSLLAGHDAS